VQQVAERDLKFHLSPRAWDHHDPEQSPWWLVPSTDWPAYAFGKYFFRWTSEQCTEMLAGFQVERGVDAVLTPVFKSASIVTQPGWEWFRFVRSVKNGTFEDALAIASDEIKTTIYIRLAVGIANPKDRHDRAVPQMPKAQVTFVWERSTRFLTFYEAHGDQTLVPGATGAKTLAELLDAVAAADGQEWLWVNILTGIRLVPIAGSGVTSDEQLWRKFLSRFKTWASP